MQFKTPLLVALFAIAALFLTSVDSSSAQAQSQIQIPKTYKVQVQYWFFDTDYYYWSTKLETNNSSEANFLYQVLLWAKQNGELNAAAPSTYWRYIAVDVRMVVEYDWDWFQPVYPEIYQRNFYLGQ